MESYLDVQHLTKSFGEKVLFDDMSFSVSEGQKVGLVARNGTGKSTLLSILHGDEGYDAGQIVYRNDIRVGYLEQTPHFNPTDTVLDACFNHEGNPEKVLRAKQVLTQLRIEDLEQKVGELSGGQLKRVALANVLLLEPDFLILDEPTNDLDIQTLQVLEEYLQDFPGCVIVISHDRYFTDKVVDHLLVFHGEGDIQDFPGNYTQYRDYQKLKSKEEDDRRQEEKKPKRERADYRNETRRKMTYKEKMEFERLEKEMGELEQEREQLEAALCSGTLSIDELTEKSKRLPEVKELIDEKEMRWLELSEIGG